MLRNQQVLETGSQPSTQAKFDATTFGFGLTPTLGVRGIWIALDMNFTWNDIPQLSKPAFAYVFGPRFGKSINLKKPDAVNRFLGRWDSGLHSIRVQAEVSNSTNFM